MADTIDRPTAATVMKRVTLTVESSQLGLPRLEETCRHCIEQRLELRDGIGSAKLTPTDGDHVAIDIEYDPERVTLGRIRRIVEQTATCSDSDVDHMVVPIHGLISPKSERLVEAVLNRLPGVTASASFAAQALRVEYDRARCPLPQIQEAIHKLGMSADFEQARWGRPGAPVAMTVEGAAAPTKPPARTARVVRAVLAQRDMLMAIVGGLLLLAAMIVKWLDGPMVVHYVVLGGACVSAGWYTVRQTLRELLHLQLTIDTLMVVAAVGAASIGHPEEGGLLLFLFALGNAGEHMAMHRARRAIEALSKLAPDVATLRDTDGSQREVKVETLKAGDTIVVRPFARVPVDAMVTEGTSAVDQSPITGESAPVDKAPSGDSGADAELFAGTINGEGLLVATVSRPAESSTLARIIRLVEEAQTTKSPTQLFTDKVERVYVPLVLVATGALIIGPPLLLHHAWAEAFYRAMAFLTAASPCALAIGTPAAVLCGIARSAQLGVLIKGGAHLETLGRVRAIAFDKTGTLTRGRPRVTDVKSLNGMLDGEVLSLAAAIESATSHPLAEAIVAEAQSRGISDAQADEVEQVAGVGVVGRVGERRVSIGRIALFDSCSDKELLTRARAAADAFGTEGKTVVAVAVDDAPAGLIALADQPREQARVCIESLRTLGVDRMVMLTGDRRAVADAVAKDVGVDQVEADLMPGDKVNVIQQLVDRYTHVAMIGDGVNDAPALANASVGIAMGAAGTDVAMETADVVLMADDLAKLPVAVGLSRASRRIIVQNLVIALGTILVLAPAAALGFAQLGVAVLMHEGSTVVVVMNALRLLRYRAQSA